MEAQDTLDAAGAAAILHTDAATVLQLARCGDLPGTKIGKGWVFLRADVLEFLRLRVMRDTAQRRKTAIEQLHPAAVLAVAPRSRKRRALPELPVLATLPPARQP
ncbi:MAG: helix-turn-helix domain-containing protein [Duganella sp.]